MGVSQVMIQYFIQYFFYLGVYCKQIYFIPGSESESEEFTAQHSYQMGFFLIIQMPQNIVMKSSIFRKNY